MSVKRTAFTEAMRADLYKYFWEAYPQKASVWEGLFEIIQSTGAYEKFTSAIGFGELLEKPEGEALQTEEPMESYTILCKNTSYGRKTNFSYESVKDSRKGNLMQSAISTWAQSVVRSKELFYAKFFINGALDAGHTVFNNTIAGETDASGNLIYDGVPFFDTAHPDRVGNTYSNFDGTNSLTHGNLETTYLTYTTTNNRDERGNVFEHAPDVLLIPPALKFTAQVILNTSTIPGSQDSDVNVLAAIVSPQEWSYLTGVTSWFLGKRGMGLMATEREGVSLDFWYDEETKDYYASIFMRWGGCINNWRGWFGSNLDTS